MQVAGGSFGAYRQARPVRTRWGVTRRSSFRGAPEGVEATPPARCGGDPADLPVARSVFEGNMLRHLHSR